MRAASKEQADRAAALIGDNCKLLETRTSNHAIHNVHKEMYLDAVNILLTVEKMQNGS